MPINYYSTILLHWAMWKGTKYISPRSCLLSSSTSPLTCRLSKRMEKYDKTTTRLQQDWSNRDTVSLGKLHQQIYQIVMVSLQGRILLIHSAGSIFDTTPTGHPNIEGVEYDGVTIWRHYPNINRMALIHWLYATDNAEGWSISDVLLDRDLILQQYTIHVSIEQILRDADRYNVGIVWLCNDKCGWTVVWDIWYVLTLNRSFYIG